jgi:hypothetical protein
MKVGLIFYESRRFASFVHNELQVMSEIGLISQNQTPILYTLNTQNRY